MFYFETSSQGPKPASSEYMGKDDPNSDLPYLYLPGAEVTASATTASLGLCWRLDLHY